MRGTVETGRWYDIRIEVRDRTVRGYLDGQLVQEQTLPRIDKVLAIGGRDAKTGDIIVKVVNSAPEPAAMTIRLMDDLPVGAGTVTVLTSPGPLDENTFEAPTKVVPRRAAVAARSAVVPYTFEPYSLTILRLGR